MTNQSKTTDEESKNLCTIKSFKEKEGYEVYIVKNKSFIYKYCMEDEGDIMALDELYKKYVYLNPNDYVIFEKDYKEFLKNKSEEQTGLYVVETSGLTRLTTEQCYEFHKKQMDTNKYFRLISF